MTKSDIIIALVRLGFSYTFSYIGDVYSNDTRQIIFTKQGFESKPILLNDLNESHIEIVKSQL